MITNSTINERAQQLLKLLVECYIREGQPIGSKMLAQECALTMSSATIRNIMADLEVAGFIRSPHTSAGRVPTVLGYRFFVDSLLKSQNITENYINTNSAALDQYTSTQELITAASAMLSGMTKLAGVVMLPRRDTTVLRQAEFLPLADNRVLVILVLNQHEVQNRIIFTDRCYSPSELQQFGNFLTAKFAGKELQQIRHELYTALKQEQQHIQQFTQAIMQVVNQAIDEERPSDYIVAGEANLLNLADPSNLNKMRELFEAFAEKQTLLHLFDQCLHAEGVKIYIGEESGYEPFDDCSMVTAPYKKDGKVVGVLGVIGPTRMPYERAIAAVDITAKLLSAAL